MPAWRSTVSVGSSARRLALCALAVATVASSSAARAQVRIAVLPIEGPQGEKAYAEARKAAKKSGEVVPQADWDASAGRLFATSRSASDLAAVATDLKVQIIVTGKVKNSDEGGGWELSMSVRQGQTGKSAAKLKYPLKGPKVDASTLKHLADELPPAIDGAAAAPDAATTPDPSTGTGATGDDTENPVGEAMRDKQGDKGEEMPDFASWFEASFGGSFGSRNFGFDEAGTPSFRSPGTGGIQLDATVMPLAFLAGSNAALSGLGVGFTYGASFWPGSTPCYPATGGGCLPTVDSYGTVEYRYEVGVRWRWNIKKSFSSPELRVNGGYGQHAFAVQKRDYLNDHLRDIGPPDVNYSYVTVGLGGFIPVWSQEGDVMRRLSLYVDGNLLLPIDTGSIHTADEWGPGSAFGVRVDAGVDLRLWKGLFARLGAQVEYYAISFNQPPAMHNLMPPCPCGTTGGAADVYYSGILSVGYAY